MVLKVPFKLMPASTRDGVQEGLLVTELPRKAFWPTDELHKEHACERMDLDCHGGLSCSHCSFGSHIADRHASKMPEQAETAAVQTLWMQSNWLSGSIPEAWALPNSLTVLCVTVFGTAFFYGRLVCIVSQCDHTRPTSARCCAGTGFII